MSMTVVVTRNVPDRFRGFLASCMLEVAPGVYTSPDMSAGVRTRLINVCEEWSSLLTVDAGILVTWRDKHYPSGQGIWCIGFPKSEQVEADGMWLLRHPLPPADEGSLTTEDETPER